MADLLNTQNSATRSAINQRQIQLKRQNTKYTTCGRNKDSQCDLQSSTENMEGKEKTVAGRCSLYPGSGKPAIDIGDQGGLYLSPS